ncbi:helix-turn-helix transcriptional regulator [Pseudoteredinibacter isoporae]|uniref:helix-turn-helix transcriptional regulator n=1 Tax=Pseudoteredinibacter isoporae TaxID=570281 RepID=UPI00333EC3B0
MNFPDHSNIPVLAMGAEDLSHFYHAQHNAPNRPFGVHTYKDSEFSHCINGQYWLYPYQDIGLIGIRDFTIEKDFISHSRLNDMLSLEYVLSGGSDMELNHNTVLSDGIPRTYLTHYGPAGRQTRFHKSTETIRGLGLWMNTDKLITMFQPEFDHLPATIQEQLQSKNDKVFSTHLSKPIKDTLETILAMPFEHHMAGIYLQAKITELLFHTFNGFYQLKHGPGEGAQISHHKAKALAFVLQSINNNLAVPPDIDWLAKETGLSRSNLLNTFKASVGMNLSDYLLQQRMESARSFIRSGKNTVLETALSVGYQDQSAFGRAYKRYFGHSPKNDRP